MACALLAAALAGAGAFFYLRQPPSRTKEPVFEFGVAFFKNPPVVPRLRAALPEYTDHLTAQLLSAYKGRCGFHKAEVEQHKDSEPELACAAAVVLSVSDCIPCPDRWRALANCVSRGKHPQKLQIVQLLLESMKENMGDYPLHEAIQASLDADPGISAAGELYLVYLAGKDTTINGATIQGKPKEHFPSYREYMTWIAEAIQNGMMIKPDTGHKILEGDGAWVDFVAPSVNDPNEDETLNWLADTGVMYPDADRNLQVFDTIFDVELAKYRHLKKYAVRGAERRRERDAATARKGGVN